jgi:hypothetical protein
MDLRLLTGCRAHLQRHFRYEKNHRSEPGRLEDREPAIQADEPRRCGETLRDDKSVSGTSAERRLRRPALRVNQPRGRNLGEPAAGELSAASVS